MSTKDIKVGDPIVVDAGREGIRHTTVTKVARKYFTVETSVWHHSAQFEIATGHERAKDPNYPQYSTDRAYTPEAWESKRIREDLEKALREHEQRHSFSGTLKIEIRRMTVDELLELLKLLDRVKSRREAEAPDA